MRIIRYLKNCKVAVLLIVCLLVVQAFTDLALPHYTSDIVDVGIQQSGVEHAATDEMTAKTHDEIAMMLPVDDEQTFRDAYTETDDGTYKLNDQGKKEQEELDRMVALPLVAIHYSSQIPDLDLGQVMQAYEAGAIDKQKILDMLDEAKQHMGDMGDSIVDQQAIAAAKAEYESLGYNLSDMQMGYLVRIGLLMLGLAALGMVAAVLVGFIASRTAAKVGATLRSKLFRRVVSFSDAEVQSFSAASLITRGTNDIQLVQMVTVMLLRMVLYAPILAIGGIIMVSRTNLAMSWIIILAVAVIFVLIMVLMRVALPKFQIMQTLIDRVNLVSREILTGLPVIRAFDRQPYEEKRFDEASTKLMKTQLFTNRVMTFMMPLMMLIMNGVSLLIIPRLPFAYPDAVKEKEREDYPNLREFLRSVVVPEMQIKLRQGFGRAIRTETDTCAVAMLDPRAARGRRYFQSMVEALPEMPVTGSLRAVEQFYRDRKGAGYFRLPNAG